MPTNVDELHQLWDEFLAVWPITRLRTMTLAEYMSVGNTQTFVSWIESRMDKLGSIWGGSAFKFGIYNRRDETPKESGGGASYSTEYGGTRSTELRRRKPSNE